MKKLVEKNKKRASVTLSPFGRNKETVRFTESLAPTGATPSFDWKNAAIDGAIIAFLTFFTTLGGVSLIGTNIVNTLVSATISGAAQFFVMLAIKRGLRKD